MAGSSLRNSLHRRNHKERSQPLHRAKLGLLEKHKDYVHRARDYKSKRERLKKLKEKIAFRNKDEFYWGMVKGKTEGGVHIQGRGNEPLPVDVVRILKTQDANYIRTQIAAEESKITAIKEQIQSIADLLPSSSNNIDDDFSDSEAESQVDQIDLEQLRAAGVLPEDNGKGKGKEVVGLPRRGHTIFVDGDEEPLKPSSSTSTSQPSTLNNTQQPLDLGYKEMAKSKKSKSASSRSKSDTEEEIKAKKEIEMDTMERELEKEARQHRRLLLTELSSRISRLSQLRAVESHMTLQRAMMGKGSKMVKRDAEKVVEGDSDDDSSRKVSWRPKVVKWKAERKR